MKHIVKCDCGRTTIPVKNGWACEKCRMFYTEDGQKWFKVDDAEKMKRYVETFRAVQEPGR